ncbi:transcription antitermination factor NusB [Ferruginibacter albus]|uniref:transcription antitermination factor NusB n=1 Tax=Ferruginibacter albus TaxID=2875540 RepID=UPI001CC6C516|nr:transcription antitermination factor NusB [Ferruginibacter albus]UAY50754.1 transcription antitermination factor NusB [Ferruginibacter albus]
MISRRNIRVKVMQSLYAVDSMNEVKPGEAQSILTKKMEQSRRLFIYLIYFITETARYVETDARQRASKHLPTAGDLNLNTKIAGNELLWKIIENSNYIAAINEIKPEHIIDKELLKKIYQSLTESEEYKEYVGIAARDKKSEKDILEFIFNTLLLPNESFINHVEEHFINWDDDAEMMQQLVLNYLQKSSIYDYKEIAGKDKLDFAKSLLQTVLDKKDITMEMLKPKLKNWDADRIASLDLIIIQMGICEFLYFETIPTKVTINEYIDLAKEYSTPQSGQFINGILDNIHKELSAENKIHKVTFKNSTL